MFREDVTMHLTPLNLGVIILHHLIEGTMGVGLKVGWWEDTTCFLLFSYFLSSICLRHLIFYPSCSNHTWRILAIGLQGGRIRASYMLFCDFLNYVKVLLMVHVLQSIISAYSLDDIPLEKDSISSQVSREEVAHSIDFSSPAAHDCVDMSSNDVFLMTCEHRRYLYREGTHQSASIVDARHPAWELWMPN